MEVLGPAILTILLFNGLQRMEDWLHQHVFKVGWLVTKNFQTTTILYYTFFLPGVVLYELVRYLVAGALDVRAERAIAFPESQEIAELKLNFIKLNRKAPGWKIFIINAAPPLVGLGLIYLIATRVFDFEAIFATLTPGTLEAVGAMFSRLFSTPDFWLWAYLVFTISGVTIPNWIVVSDWRSIFMTVGGVAALLFLIGIGENVSAALIPSVSNGLNTLSLLFALMLILNGLGIALLSVVENSIERVTGDSATFRNGKLIAMRRSEILALRQQEREKSLKARQQQRQKPALPAGPPSIYRLPLTIPGPPGDEVLTRAATRIIEPEERPALADRPRREQPSQITGAATPAATTATTATPAATPASPAPPQRPPPLFNPSRASSRLDDDDDDDDVDEIDDTDGEDTADADDADEIVVRSPSRPAVSPFTRSTVSAASADDDDQDDDEDESASSAEPVYEDLDDAVYPDDDDDDIEDDYGDDDEEDEDDDDLISSRL